MKKSLIIATLVGVALTSCVSESQEYPTPDQQLKFEAPMLKKSRAVAGEIDGTTYPGTESFKVFCNYYTGNWAGDWAGTSSYFLETGEAAKKVDNYWWTDKTHYWPDTQYNLVFAAYSPADAKGTYTQTNDGLNIVGFTPEATVANQYDLMYTTRVFDLNNKKDDANSAVSLVFNHALSSILFAAGQSDDRTDVAYDITKIELVGKFSTEGDFTQGITSGTNSSGQYTETSNAKWTPTTTNTVTTYDAGISTYEVQKGSALQFTSGKTAMLLIPQPIPAEAKVIVTYTKTTYNKEDSF